MILENYHFKKWIRYQISKNPGEIEEEFSKIIFDVCMVFKEDYKYSIFIMHDLIKNCGASLNYYCPNSKITPLLLLAMRNSFKEIIYMIIKDLIKLDTYQVLSLHCDNHDSKNTILHYACQYDRFVAVFRICESVFRQEYFNLKSKNSKISSKEFTLQLLEKFALLILARNINSETPKFVADFNKPSAKYVERLENYIIITSIISRRQNIHKRIKNEIIDNGELPEDTPKYKNSVRSFVPYKINMKIMQYRSKLSNIVSLSDLITFIFDKESEEDNESKDKNIGYLKESFSTSASRRTCFNDKTHYDYIKSYNKRNQKYSKIIPRSTISFYSEQSKDYQSFSSAIKQTDDKIHHGCINLREIEENNLYCYSIKSKYASTNKHVKRNFSNSKIQQKSILNEDSIILDDTESSCEEFYLYENESFNKEQKLTSLPSKACLLTNQVIHEPSKYQNYKQFIDQIKKNIRREAKKKMQSVSSNIDESTESKKNIRSINILGATSRDKIIMPFQQILD